MHTRFIPAGNFPSARCETLEFLHFPPPHLPPSYLSKSEDLRSCFDGVSALGVSLELDKLPIESSLSKFLSDVLPEFIGHNIGDFADDQFGAGTAFSREPWSFSVDHMLDIDASTKKNESFSGEEEGTDNPGYGILKQKDEGASDVKSTNDIEIIQFEIPVKYDLHCQKENTGVFSDILTVESEVDMPSLELRMQDFLEIQEAVYSNDDVLTEYFMEQKPDLLEDSGSIGGQFGSPLTAFPVFEIDEASISIFNDISVEDELLNFDNIETQKWIQEDDITSHLKELLGFKEFDLLVHLSKHYPAMEFTCSNFFREIDFISDTEDSDIEKMLLFHQETSQDGFIFSRNIILFEEFQFTGIEQYNYFDILNDLAKLATVELCNSMFSEAMEFKNFNDLIVCNELILIDDSFRSLPVPILLDNQKTESFHSLLQNILSFLEPESSSTFDGLYLDWHVLEEDNCDSNRYSSCWKVLEAIDIYSIDSALTIFENGMPVLDFVLSGDSPDRPNLDEKKEMLNLFLHGVSAPRNEVASQKLLNDDHRNGMTVEIPSEMGAAKLNVSAETMAEFNEIGFLLHPRECAGGRKFKSSESFIYKTTALPAVSSVDGAATQVPLQQWNIKILQVKLSDEILILIDNFRKSFQGILQSDSELVKALYYPYQDLGDISCLRVRKKKIMDHIKKTIAPGLPLAHADDSIMSLVALSAIKQMAWYLCYYGLHATQLFIHNLSSSIQPLKSRLTVVQNLIEDMCRNADKEIIKFHPSLSVVQQLLESTSSEIDLKILIVSEPIYWWPLKRLLTSMNISYNEPQNFRTNTYQWDQFNEFVDPTSIMFHADCCLVSHEFVAASFPFDKFGIILEYGGSHESPRVCSISSISSKLHNCSCLYFLKVELEDSGVAKAICDGVDMPKMRGSTTKGNPHIISVLNESNYEMEELLNFVPVENYNRFPVEAVDEREECYMNPLHSVSSSMQSKEVHTNNPSSPGTVIVVNTQNFDKEMIISRRSTYQKILALEKGGVQVVERDLNLPVDVIVDAAICLAWYNLKNIGKKASAPDEAFSCLPLCVENIAASVLTSLSFAFSSCILVFEGEKHFVTGIMESSDELYAAAAILGMDLQIFFSYSPIVTDEILMSCIDAVTKLTRGLYPKMPESESLAEAFLTSFPSINPLSAHAILSSGGMLIEFLEWSRDRRIHAIQKYNVPDESVALFGLLCQYGEREDSKSGMTDSSSSVSYVPNRFQPKNNSETRKRKCIDNPHNVDMCINESSLEPTLFSDVGLSPSRASVPHKVWMLENSEIIDECEKLGVSFDDKLLSQSTKLDARMMDYSKVSPLYGFGMAEGPRSEENQKPKNSWHNAYVGTKERLDMAARTKLCSLEDEKSGKQREDLIGEVIDTDVSATFRKDISMLNSLSLPHFEVNKDSAAGISRTARKLSFGTSSLATFPISADIDSDFDVWICQSNIENSSRKGNNSAPDSCFDEYKFSSKHQKGLLNDDMLQKTALNSYNQQMQDIDSSHCGGTPLWDAIQSGRPPKESPWTVEFLNRIKEKSRTRQQCLPCDLSAPLFGSSRSKSIISKRKSPSILEYYKYQKDGVPKKPVERKRQKQSVKPLCLSKNEKAPGSIPPTWTPVDKRAKRTLSFSTTGNGGQSKLIWSDNNSHTLSRRILLQLR
ncbi:hypothetical protein ACH5RR_017104 [Cinchona calisaya]|uniref:Protein SHORTAGE IN CHIASMATA 1 n=1 Tax=Cinchona calisaya TaxID=153742 RepID=A0ABD2ZXU2_9GENT